MAYLHKLTCFRFKLSLCDFLFVCSFDVCEVEVWETRFFSPKEYPWLKLRVGCFDFEDYEDFLTTSCLFYDETNRKREILVIERYHDIKKGCAVLCQILQEPLARLRDDTST